MAPSGISDKYLALHASFQVLKKELWNLQITCIDIPGILSGSPLSFIHICQEIFLSPARPELRETCTNTYRLSSGMTDYRFCDTILRISRTELGLNPRLSTEQFLNNGNFVVRRIELLTDIARAVYKREGKHRPERTPSTVSLTRPGSSSGGCPETPVESTTLRSIFDLIRDINSKVVAMDTKVTEKFEQLEARISLLETRFRVFSSMSN